VVLLGSLDHDGKEVVDAVRCRRCGEGNGRRGVGEGNAEVHHAAPRCLLRLWDWANGALPNPDVSPAWLEWAGEAGRWGVPVTIERGVWTTCREPRSRSGGSSAAILAR
jgi:hypothetical protein